MTAQFENMGLHLPNSTAYTTQTMTYRPLALGVALSFLLSFLSMVEYAKVAGGIFDAWDAWHYANMAGLAPSPLQQRILSFLIPEALHQSFGLSILHSYLLERFTFLALSGTAMFILAARFVSTEKSLALLLIFFMFYNLSSLAHIQPAEEVNIFVFALCFLLIDSRRFTLLLLTAAVGAAVKTTIIFIVPIYFVFCILTRRPAIRTLVESGVLVGVISAIAGGIALHYSAPREYLGGLWQYTYNTQQILDLSPQSFPFILVSLAPMLCVFHSWQKQPPIIQAVAIVCPLFVAGHYLISRVEEFRTFMPIALALLIGMLIFSSQSFQAHPTNARRG
ncbi:hypothetical protein AAFN46_13240 [Pseudomonas sp. CAU 1711]|uniref:hypothetical protein n=1 Tax=Pseudomonas sp. CAU 1711 TaxID=3140356 RepID=UPI0032619751